MIEPLVLLGAGGHAKVLIEVIRCAGLRLVACAALESERPDYLPKEADYFSSEADLSAYTPGEVLLVNGLGSVRAPDRRARLYRDWKARGYRFATLVHPSAVVALGVALGEGCQVMAGAVIQPAVRVGENCIINTCASVDHDCRIGAHSHIAPGAVLSGDVRIGERVHVGVGAVVIQGVEIGPGSVVGAGAAVIANVDAGTVMIGVPAQAVRS